MTKLIWFDAVQNAYFSGSRQEYEIALERGESVSVVYELTELSSKLAGRLVSELNSDNDRIKEAV